MELQICLYALLSFLLQFVPTFSSLTKHSCHRDESIALLQFKEMFSINASNSFYSYPHSYPKISSWNKSTDCCTWDGVTCHEMTGHVIGLDLSCSQLQGAISPDSSLFKLSQLEKLNLAYNDFKGSQISHGFGGFPRLIHLNLSTSNFSGQIALEISHLSKLVLLDLSDLSPIFPFDFSLVQRRIRLGQHDFHLLLNNLTQISVLRLHGVDISSEIPSNLSSSLSYLDLSSTGVHGKLPNDVFQLPKLQTLRLSYNQNLTCSFPKFNCSMSPLQELDLSGTRIFGELPSSIGCLKSLKVLRLPYCQISGPLPESIGNFSELIDLDLSDNKFTGQIPASISNLGQLQRFDLKRNKLEGRIPDSFTNLSKLRFLSLYGNNLIGCFPHSITNLRELEILYVGRNSIAGPLPSNVSGLQKLTYLDLANNSLNGTLPSWLFTLPKLKSLDLSLNQFTGQMVDFEENSSLVEISLGNNQLNGPIPESISILLNLTRLELSTNSLSGIIEPNMFSSLQKLEILDLSHNRLQWRIDNDANISLPNLWYVGLSSCAIKEIPDFIQNSKMLTYLMLSHNNIHQLPSWLISMPSDSLKHLNLSHNSLTSLVPLTWNLWTLDFRFNQIQGPLPLSICNLDELRILDLSNNQFAGAIPQCFGNFSSELLVLNLKNNRLQGKIALTFATSNKLASLGLNGNFLEGSLPRSLANCEQLEVLDVGNNNISDTFPTWLENLKELQVLILKSNRFFGSIGTLKTRNPFSNLRVIDISINEFDGVLPTELLESFRAMMSIERNQSEARYIEIQYADEDYYPESIDMVMKGSEFEFTKILTTLTSIDVSSNRFSGEIPKIIGNLVSIRYLNLSHNRLSGHIPSTLGNLSSLESLDISCNQIEGEIPRQLTLITSLAFLNLSQNHLVGRIPQGQQFNTFSSDSYKGNLGLCGSPLTTNCKENKMHPPFSQSIPQQEEDSDFFSGFTWQSVIMGYGCGIFLGVAVGTLMFLTQKPEKFVRFIEGEIYHCALFLSRKIHMHKSSRRPKRRGHKERRQVISNGRPHFNDLVVSCVA